jgi:Ca-activated chloride channel family protein
VAKSALEKMLEQLKSADRFSLVTFDDSAQVVVPLEPLGDRKKDIIRRMSPLETRGGTNFECGYVAAANVMEKVAKLSHPNEFENRIVILTDDMPNAGDTSPTGLLVRLCGKKKKETIPHPLFLLLVALKCFNPSHSHTHTQKKRI